MYKGDSPDWPEWSTVPAKWDCPLFPGGSEVIGSHHFISVTSPPEKDSQQPSSISVRIGLIGSDASIGKDGDRHLPKMDTVSSGMPHFHYNWPPPEIAMAAAYPL